MSQLPLSRLPLLVCVLAAAACGPQAETADKDAPAKAASPPAADTKKEAKKTPEPSEIVVADVGFQTPESVLHDPQADRYLVSNIEGDPLDVDGNGFISRLTPDGEVEALKWIDGFADGVTLNAPKGMAILSGILSVADIDHVRHFDRETGAPRGQVKVEGATFLNDLVATSDGSLFVSDSGLRKTEGGVEPSGSDAIHKIDATGMVTTFLASDELGKPNGLHVDPIGLLVVTFGSGEYYQVTPAGERGKPHKLPMGQLDGVVGLGDGRVLISSWGAKGLYAGKPGGEFTLVVKDLEAPADIGLDQKRGRVLIPLFNDNKVVIRRVL